MTIRTVHVGLGPIGLNIVRALRDRDDIEVIGAVDIDPQLTGRDLGVVAGLGSMGVKIHSTLADAGPPGAADVVVLSTGSFLRGGVARQVSDALSWGASVISTCEELAFPWRHHPTEAHAIDAEARRAGRSVLAAGINPGFAMDLLVLYATALSDVVSSVRVRRVVDVGKRRIPLQEKVGVGIDQDEFTRRRAARSIGHVGLVESVALLDAALRLGVDRIEETLDSVTSSRRLETDGHPIQPGTVVGIRQVARGYRGTLEVVNLELEMYLDAPDAGDRIELRGSPDLTIALVGIAGDEATASVIVNGIPAVLGLAPGLATVIDLAPLRWTTGARDPEARGLLG